LDPESPALLLEGSWPAAATSEARWSLDASIGPRHAWIDEQAVEWAESLADCGLMLPRGNRLDRLSLAYLSALELRYYLVKLMRLVAFFSEVQPLRAGQSVELSAQRHRDHDYANILEQLSRMAGIDCCVRWINDPQPPGVVFPYNGWLRQLAGRLTQCFDAKKAERHLWCEPSGTGPFGQAGPVPFATARRGLRVVLCGNPNLLDPVCVELLRRRASVWWLFDRFAVKPYFRWRPRGVRQLVCNASLGRENRFYHRLPERLDCLGVNLAPAVNGWLSERLSTHGPRQTRLVEQIDAYFQRVAPDALILEEDATPLGRAAVAVAQLHSAVSLVVQHGAPCCRFGFAPLVADRILAWGISSREQLVRWGISPEQIRITGSPRHDQLRARLTERRLHSSRCGTALGRGEHKAQPGSAAPYLEESVQPHFLLLSTMPPRDDRPDAVTLGLTTQSYAEMLRTVLAVVARRPGVRLTIKLHPRAVDDPILRQVLAGFPQIEAELIQQATLEETLHGVDCIFSYGSSAGVEATLAGIPVIQVLPPGVDNVLPYQSWGLLGTAHNAAELEPLVRRALDLPGGQCATVDPRVFGDFQRPAAERIVAEIFALGQAADVSPSVRINRRASIVSQK
jgi:hypothetical protein